MVFLTYLIYYQRVYIVDESSNDKVRTTILEWISNLLFEMMITHLSDLRPIFKHNSFFKIFKQTAFIIKTIK